ncbi:MAG: flagellar M-ring protein FliF [Acidobacteriales bacterium]|nr:flagellar M-ring protein FliF [Terriglobales bacterium]
MNQILRLIGNLTLRQRVTIIAAAAVVVAGLIMFSRWSHERDFRPLYTSLSPEDGGAVVAKLKETGVEYRLSENGTTVMVPSARVAELRLQMAAAGLPKSGRMGFELFDKTNFGATDFTEQVNFRRALEGELERSVMALSEVEQARVHITFPKESIFLESRQPAKSSVLLKLRPGAKLSPANVLAVTHLVASAVDGLAPEAVSVLDMQGNLLNRPRRGIEADGAGASEGFLDYRRSLEKDLVAKIGTALEPLLGPDGFRASATVECDFSAGEQTEETYDPSRSVMVSQQRTEDISGAALVSGTPGTASNLPRPISRPGSGTSGGVARRTENIAYQSSRTTRHLRLPQGTLKRMSLAVLVDHTVRWEGTGARARRILEPASPEKLKAVRDLVAAATGFTPDRGDLLTVENQPFESTLSWEPPAASPVATPAADTSLPLPAWLNNLVKQKNMAVLIGVGAGLLLLLILLVSVLILKARKRRKKVVEASIEGPAALTAGDAGAPAAIEKGPDLEQQMAAKLAEQAAMKDRLEAEALNSLKLPQVTTKKTEVLTKHINTEAKKDPGSMAHLVRTWLNEREH